MATVGSRTLLDHEVGEKSAPKRSIARRRLTFLCLVLIAVLGVAFVNWRHTYVSWRMHAARLALLESNPESAVEILEQAANIQPDRTELLYLLARAYRRTGDLGKGQQYLDRAASQGWSTEQINQQRYLAMLQTGQAEQVEPYFKRWLQAGASDELAVEYYEAQAQSLLHSYRFKEAMVCLNYWIDWRPRSIRARMWRAEIWERILYHAEAIAEYQQVLEQSPDYFEARRGLARNYFEANKIDLALAEFTRCLQLDPKDAEARIGSARCQRRLTNYAAAEKQLLELTTAQLTAEQRVTVLTELASIKLEQSRPEEAIELLTESNDARANPVAQYVLSRAYSRMGDGERAASHGAESKRLYARYTRLAEITTELLTEPVNADLRCEAGKILMELGMAREGAAWMSTALGDDPRHEETHAALAQYYAEVGELGSAETHRSRAETDGLLERVVTSVHSNDVHRIREQLTALEDGSGPASLKQLLRAALLVHERNPDAALAELELVLQLARNRVRTCALVLSGQALTQLGRQKEAERVWIEVVTETPDAVEAHRWLAMMYYELGAMDAARTHALRVGELMPQDPRPYRLLGLMRKDSEHYEDAIAYYQEALSRRPLPPGLHEIQLELAECQMKLGEYTAALATLRDCPRSVKALVLRAECHFSTSAREQADILLQEALLESPDDFPALMLQATMALEHLDLPTAATALTRALAVRPRDYQANLLMMQTFQRMGKREQALEISQKVNELRKLRLEFSELHRRAATNPTDAAIRYRLGQVAMHLDRPELAQGWFRATLAMDPAHKEARRELELLTATP